jgi:hypothetical protein
MKKQRRLETQAIPMEKITNAICEHPVCYNDIAGAI